MIPQKSGIQVQSTVVGESFAMKIDNSMLTHIMGILTDLYADPILAVIREYVTNALDSHIAAGATRPVEVCTPTSLRPIFTVRDFGLGLDEDDIENIYSQYGVSTKRESNDAVGMLGIGCKSALAYVDQFTVIGFKGGVRTTVVVSRDSKGAGSMVVLDKSRSEEPNGVEIIVPVNGSDDFLGKAKSFFRFWEPGTVLLDGVEPQRIEGFDLSETMTVIRERHGHDRNAWIVMGNVPYPANLDIDIPGDNTLVARVPIGSVQFAPSREALQDTEYTREALKAVSARYEELASTAAQREADASTSAPEAARRAARAAFLLNRKMLATWEGEMIPRHLAFGEVGQPFVGDIIGEGSTASRHKEVPIRIAASGLWVLGFDNQVFSRPMRSKLLAYCDAHQIEVTGEAIAYHGETVPYPKWMGDDVKTVEWESVRRWRDPNKKRSTGRSRGNGAYDGIDAEGEGRSILAEEIDETLPLFYADNHEQLVNPRNHRVLSEAFDGCYLVRMPSTRIAKFLRIFPEARPAREALTEVAEAWWESLKGGERIALAGIRRASRPYWSNPADVLLEMGELAHRFADPDLRTLLLARAHRTEALVERYGDFSRFLSADLLSESGPTLTEVAARYPLCPSRLGSHKEQAARLKQQILIYVNAAHVAAVQTAQENEAE